MNHPDWRSGTVYAFPAKNNKSSATDLCKPITLPDISSEQTHPWSISSHIRLSLYLLLSTRFSNETKHRNRPESVAPGKLYLSERPELPPFSPSGNIPKTCFLFLKHPFGASHLILKLPFGAIKKAYGQMIWNCRHKKWYRPGFLPSSTIFHFLGPS